MVEGRRVREQEFKLEAFRPLGIGIIPFIGWTLHDPNPSHQGSTSITATLGIKFPVHAFGGSGGHTQTIAEMV
jgi:hypothetical protein